MFDNYLPSGGNGTAPSLNAGIRIETYKSEEDLDTLKQITSKMIIKERRK